MEDYESALYSIFGVSCHEKIWLSLSLVFIEDGELTVVESSVDDGVGLVGCLLLLADDLADGRSLGQTVLEVGLHRHGVLGEDEDPVGFFVGRRKEKARV